jgi:hypothetical protein
MRPPGQSLKNVNSGGPWPKIALLAEVEKPGRGGQLLVCSSILNKIA